MFLFLISFIMFLFLVSFIMFLFLVSFIMFLFLISFMVSFIMFLFLISFMVSFIMFLVLFLYLLFLFRGIDINHKLFDINNAHFFLLCGLYSKINFLLLEHMPTLFICFRLF